MEHRFDPEEAKQFLIAREEKKKQDAELERKALLKQVVDLLKAEFHNTSVEVFLIGSIIKPFSFSQSSDVDIVLKNYQNDRFDFWTKIEGKINRKVEVILFEKCHFQKFILEEGLKIV